MVRRRPLRSNCLKIEKSPPKGLILPDFSCIFAISVLAYMVFLLSTNLGEISDIIKPW